MTTHLVWLRNDLRMTDNKALHAACSDPDARVLAVFIATPQQWRQHEMAPRQAEFIHANLLQMQQALAERGIPLSYHQCDDFAASVDWLTAYCAQERVDTLFYNRQYEINERQRDQRLEQRLSGQVICQSFDDSLLLPPGSVKTGGGEMYKIYTPFRKAFIQRLTESDVRSLPAPKPRASGALSVAAVPAGFDYPPAEPSGIFPPGKRRRCNGCVPFAVSRCRITLNSGIGLLLPVPAACRPIWRSAHCRHDSVSTACALNVHNCSKITTAVPLAG